MNLDDILGIGEVVWKDNKPFYRGTFPESLRGKDFEVLMLPKEYIDLLLENSLRLLELHPYTMPPNYYDTKVIAEEIETNGTIEAFFPDEMHFKLNSKAEPIKLFLDRKFYSIHPEKELIIRYVSAEGIWEETNEIKP